jgi:hypothetical protein
MLPRHWHGFCFHRIFRCRQLDVVNGSFSETLFVVVPVASRLQTACVFGDRYKKVVTNLTSVPAMYMGHGSPLIVCCGSWLSC